MKRRAELTQLLHQAERLGVRLTASAAERLLAYESLLRERAIPKGIVSAKDLPRLRERHILDCLRAVAAVEPMDRTAADLGSGAGLPGIVVAIALPHLRVALVERRRLRVAFLELVVEQLDLSNADVVQAEIERVNLRVDVCFARALAPFPETLRLAAPLLGPGGRLVVFAGEGAQPVPERMSGWRIRRMEHPVLEGAGPLVIMTRQ